jgi:hypothetical protein
MIAAWLSWAVLAGSIGWWLYNRAPQDLKPFFWPALLLKFAAGLTVGVLYLYVFERGDTFRFFEDAVQLADVATGDPVEYLRFLWQADESFAVWPDLRNTEPRSLFFAKLLSMICLVSHANYWLCSLWLSFIAFVCLWLFVQRVAIAFPGYGSVTAIAFLIWPTVVFWSSGVLKETIAFAAICTLVRLALEFSQQRKLVVTNILQALLAVWLAWSLKYYWLGLLAPALVVVAARSNKYVWRMGVLAGALFVLVVALHPNFYPNRILAVITENYYQFHFLTGGNNTFHFHDLQPTWISMLVNSPEALFSGLYRPFLWESSTIFHVLAALENLVLLLLTIHTLFYFRLARVLWRWMIPLFSYALMECVFLTLSTPSWGTLIRYRVGLLPFVVLFLLMSNSRITQFFQRSAD